MSRHYLPAFFTVLLLITSNHALSAIYKWKNEEGQIHYGSIPPQGVTFEKMGVSTKFTPPPTPKTSKSDDKNANSGSKEASSGGAGGDKKDPYSKAQHTELCNNAKKDLANLSKGGRLRVRQDDGSTAVMSETDKTARTKTMQGIMKKHCK